MKSHLLKDKADPIIHFRHVSFSYPGSGRLFHKLSLPIHAGQVYHLKGSSGSGKSTLLRLMIRLEQPTQGEILFKGQPLSQFDPPRLRRSILYLPQTPVAIDGAIRDFLLMPFAFKANQNLDVPTNAHLKERLKVFRMEDLHLTDPTQTLSVGQLQRLCFIRGLLLSPEVLLLDEPTSALDPKSAIILTDHMQTLCQTLGMTILLVSHDSAIPTSLIHRSMKVAGGRVKALS